MRKGVDKGLEENFRGAEAFFNLPVLFERAGQLDHFASPLKLAHDLPAEQAQRLGLPGAERTRRAVQDAQRAQRPALGRHQRRSGVEARARAPLEKWIGGKTLIPRRVLDDEQIAASDGLAAERTGPWRAGQLESEVRLEPKPRLVNDRNQRHRRGANAGGQPRQVVECRLGRRVEHGIAAERGQT